MAARATSMPPTNARAAAATAAAIAAASIATNAGTGTAATSTTGTPSAASNAATSGVAAARALDLPTLQTESPHTLAARAESVPPKASAIWQTLTSSPGRRTP